MTRDPDRTQTHIPAPANHSALDAGLAAAFGPATAGWSQPPLLRDDSSDGPLVQPASPEMPRSASDRYQLLGEIARGGMGVILKGRDPRLGRDMAFKVLKTEHIGKPAAAQRFVEEAQVGGQLQHPGILPVYDLGRFEDGRPYFAMKFVKGDTLADQLAERASPSADRGNFLQIFLKVCETVAYAHSRGVIHRDIKPSNIMVANYGEVLVMDWGLAKVLPRGGVADEVKATQMTREPEPPRYEPTVIHTARAGSIGSETLAGSVMGTPAFMPPEQAGGEVDKLDERADVFGLGAVLCVILTGKPPYVAADTEAVRLMAVRGKLDGAFSRLDECGSDVELVGLCKRCLNAEPADRPRHAGEVKEAVASYLAGVEVRAHRAEIERAAAEAKAAEQRKRRRVQAGLGTAVTAALLVGGAGLWWADRQSTDRRHEREVAHARDREVVTAALDQAEASLKADKMPDVDAALAQAATRLEEADGQDLRNRYDDLKRDRDVVLELDNIAERRWTVHGEGGYRLAGTNPKIGRWFDEAFRRYGLVVGESDPAKVVERVRASRVSAALVAGLNEWFFLVPKQSGLLAVLDSADPEPLRVEVRAAVAAGLAECVCELAAKMDAAALTPGFAVALGMHPALSDEDGYKLMRAAWDAHPDSFGLALRIGTRVSSMAGAIPRDRERTLEAAAWNRTAVALRPQSAVAHNNLGVVLNQLGDHNGAEAAYRRAVQCAPDMVLAHTHLIELRAKKPGELDAALADARRLVERFPDSAGSHGTLGYVLLARKEYPAAAAALREAIARGSTESAYHVNLGMCLFNMHSPRGAVTACSKAIDLYPENQSAYETLAIALGRLKDNPGVVAALQKAIAISPNVDRDHRNLGLALRLMGDHAGSKTSYCRAIELDPKNPANHTGLGATLKGIKKYADAATAYCKALEINPDYADAHHGLGLVYLEQNDYPAAEASLRRAIELNPKAEVYYVNLAEVLAKRRNPAAVVAALRDMAAADPNNPTLPAALGRYLRDRGDYRGAADAFRQATNQDSKNAGNWNDLGAVLSNELKNYVDAENAFSKAIELDPANRVIYENMCINLTRRKDWPRAIAAGRKAVELVPEDPAGYVRLFTALSGAQLYAEARGVIADARARLPIAFADPRTGLRYNSACAAALAGDRAPTYDWLAADLAGWTKLLADHPTSNAPEVRRLMSHWLADDDLFSVRDPKPLAALPAEERAKWEKLWADVRKLLNDAQPRELGPPPREVK